MDELTNTLYYKVTWDLLFVDGIKLLDEYNEDVNQIIKLWKTTLENTSFMISKNNNWIHTLQFNQHHNNKSMVRLDIVVFMTQNSRWPWWHLSKYSIGGQWFNVNPF